MNRSAHSTLTALALLLLAPLLMAQGRVSQVVEEEGADFWGDIADPGRREFLTSMKTGKAYFQSATTTRSRLSRALLEQLLREGTDTNPKQLRLAAMKSALTSFQAAVKASPLRAEGYLWLGQAQDMLARMAPGEGRRVHDPAMLRAAAASFTRARELDPRLDDSYLVASAMGDILFSQGQLERAVMAYEQAERNLAAGGDVPAYDRRRKRARVLSHTAECLMGLGRLEESILRYQEALTMGYDSVLNHWGLAVAYDRDEQQDKALAHARRAMARDRSMRALSSPTVFFVPDGEVHYYHAVGHLAQGNPAQARRSFQAYLEKQPDSQWAPRARVHLVQLGGGGAARAPSPKEKKMLAPKPGQTGAGLEEQDRSRYRVRLRSRLSYLRRCYMDQLKKKSTLSGRVKVAFQVGKDGKASRLRVKHSTLRSPGLRRCLFNVIQKIYFRRPSAGKVVEVDYTFEFRPLQ